MNQSPSRRFIAGLMSALWGTMLSGCATWDLNALKLPEPPVPDVRPIRKQRAEQAVKAFDEQRNRGQYQAAATAWRQGDFQACRESLSSVLARDPSHRESLLLLAEVELEHDSADKAVELLRRAAEAHPADAEVAYKLALALQADGEGAEALHHFHTACNLAPGETKYSEAFKLAREAANDAEDVVALPITDNEVAPPQIDAAVRADVVVSDERLDEPNREVAAAVAAPAPDLEFETILQHWDSGRKHEAETALKKLLAKNPKHIEGTILQTEFDLAAERFTVARERMERLVVRNPSNAQVRRACGLVYRALGDEQAAVDCLTQADLLDGAVRANGGVVPASFETDLIESPTEDAVEPPQVPQWPRSEEDVAQQGAAEPSDREVISQEPAFAPVVEASFTAQERLDRGIAALQIRQVDVARDEFAAAFALSPDDAHLVIEAAVQSLKYEQPALAAKLTAEGVKQFPRSAALYRLQGTAAYQLGKYREAESALRQSLSLDNSQGLTYFLLGSALNRLGDTEAAEGHFRQAARLDRRLAARK